MYDMEDEYPLENHSLMDIMNLKLLHKLLYVYSFCWDSWLSLLNYTFH